MRNRKVRSIHQTAWTKCPKDGFERGGFTNGARIEPDIIQPSQCVNSFNCVVRIEAARRMSQNQSNVRISRAVSADGLLVRGVCEGSCPNHVQRYGEAEFICDSHMIFRQIARDGRIERWMVCRVHVIALQSREPVALHGCEHLSADIVGLISIWAARSRSDRAASACHEPIRGIHINGDMRKTEEEAVASAARMDAIHLTAEGIQPRARRSGFQKRRRVCRRTD